MSSPEVEAFEITDEDLANEFFPKMGRRQTKNQATFGIWADPESDEENTSRRRRKKDFAFPVNFVSGGIKQGDKISKEGEDSDSNNDGDFDPSMLTRGFEGKKSKSSKYQKTGGGARFAGESKDKAFGSWEKHTKGIGQKLLEKMGYEHGKGLGKNKQGITTPVEAVRRRGKAAVGAYGSERSERSLKDYPVVDSEEEEEKEFQEQLQQWKKQPEGIKKKPKYVYKTAQEVIDSGTGKRKKVIHSEIAKGKVIDMTGKEKRVLSGYHAIAHRHDKPDEEEEIEQGTEPRERAFDMPELKHNLNLLVDMAEENIIQNDRKLKHERDLVVNMRYEKERLDNICEQEAIHLDKLRQVLDTVDSCKARLEPGCDDPLTLDECASIFRHLQDDFYEEYKMYDLAALAIALVFPMMKQYLSSWDPLKDSKYGINNVQQWQVLLEDPNHQYVKDINNMDVYQKLVWDVWLPVVRTTILKWNARDCDPLIEMLENWMPILPPWILENILDQLVLPRLLQEVDNWNPLTDTMPIHAWLHPWLPLMGDKLEPLYAPIRHKLANALTNWHPSDASAKVILQPWMRVFKQGHMEAFLVKNILPKLAMVMNEFSINPHQQILDPWHWVMSWSDIIPQKHIVSMLEKLFFPKWLQVLCSWLGNMPNYEEVTKWYLGWKSLLSEQLMSHSVVKDQFNKALDIMNRAVSGHFQPGAKENMAYFTHTERRQMGTQPGPPPPIHPPPPPLDTRDMYDNATIRSATTSYPSSFKELVEKKAEENNILFVPIPGKTQEAKQVYRYGRVMMYLDRSVIFMFDSQQWIPVSLQQLIDNAKE